MQLGIRAKLLVGFGAVLVLLGVVSATGIRGMAEMDAQTTQIIDRRLAGLYYAEDASSAGLAVQRGISNLILARDKGEMSRQVANIEKNAATLDDNIAQLKAAVFTDEGRGLFVEIEAAWANVKSLQSAVTAAALQDDDARAMAELQQWRVAADRLDVALNQMVEHHKAQADSAADMAEAAYRQARLTSLVVSGFALLIGLAVAFVLAHSIVTTARSVQATVTALADECVMLLAEALDAFASNDLTVELRPVTPPIEHVGSDEIGQTAAATNRLREKIIASLASDERARAGLREIVGQAPVQSPRWLSMPQPRPRQWSSSRPGDTVRQVSPEWLGEDAPSA